MGVITKNAYYGTPPVVTSGSIFYVDFLNQKSYISGSTIVRDMLSEFSGSFVSSGSTIYLPSYSNESLFFSGSSAIGGGYVNFGLLTSWTPTPTGFSVFAFIQRVTGSTSQIVICKDDATAAALRDFQLQINTSNQVALTVWNNSAVLRTVAGGTTVPVGNWNYVGGTWNGSTVTTYKWIATSIRSINNSAYPFIRSPCTNRSCFRIGWTI